MVEKEKGLKIQSIRSDRGGEFLSKEFNKISKDNRIQRFLTAPYSPQQNGVVGRKNITILNMSLDNKTLQEAWNGMKPTVSHLRIFRSIAYVHVPSQRRSKLDDRSEKHVFIGYDKHSKGYKLYNLITKKVVVSRDVDFEEEESWDWRIEEHERYDFLPMTDEDERVVKEAMKSKKWRQAMEEEIKSIEKNNTRSGEVQGKTHGKRWKIHQIDVNSAIDLAKNPVYHDRSKHINTRYNFIRECIARKEVQRPCCKYRHQVAQQAIFHKTKDDAWIEEIKFKGGSWIVNLI
nr:retrovirus-related Pol polyprotein from transposon TNT 1-94 [Tanacetum cinerariifolium]